MSKLDAEIDAVVIARLRAPFGCEYIQPVPPVLNGRWRIHDANDDAIASVNAREEGYARLIVQALNEHFERRAPAVSCGVLVEVVRPDGKRATLPCSGFVFKWDGRKVPCGHDPKAHRR